MIAGHAQDQAKVAKRHLVILAALALFASSLACSLALPFSTSHAPGTSIPEAPLGLIAYVGKDGNIYTTDRNGKQLHAITKDASPNPSGGQVERVYQYLTWAPDGQHLAFIRVNLDQSGQEVSVLSALSDGRKPVNNFTSQDFQPFYLFWSPDSQTIAFLGSDATTGALGQYVVGGSGGESKFISSGQPYYWDWSPDNRTMIVHIGGASSLNPDAQLAFIGVDGSSPNRNLSVKPGFFDAPDWSPAGDGVVLSAQNDSGNDELILAGQDGKVKKVLASLSGPVTFAWSPKGIHLAYAVYDTTGSAPTIHLVVLDSTHPDLYDQIAQGDVVAYFWSPDGRKIAYFVPESGGPTASSVQMVAQTNASAGLAVWVYDRVDKASKKIATFAPTDSFQQIFSYYSQYQRSDTIWSPDSQALVLSGVDLDGKNVIYTVDVDGSHFQKIADGELAFWSWK
jgi:Tol biopolymer transport system component